MKRAGFYSGRGLERGLIPGRRCLCLSVALLWLMWQCPVKTQAYAADGGGWFFNPSLFYLSSETTFQPDWTGSGGTGSWTKINAAAGYSMAGGLLLGIKYFSEDRTSTPQGTGDSVTETLTAAGVSVGFHIEQLVLLVSVMGVQPPKYTNSVSEITLSDGTGTLLDLMYLADLGGWYLGPQISWRSFEYKKYVDGSDPDSSASEAFTKATEVHLEPYLSVFILF